MQKDIKKIFNRDGFIVLKNFISKSLINNLEKNTKRIVRKNLIKNKLRDIHYLKNGELSSIHNINNYMSYHKKIDRHTKITKVFKKIFGEPSKQWFNASYFVKPKKSGIATKAHQDNAFFNLRPCEDFTCWIPTVNLNGKNSSLYYYLGSNKEGLQKHIPEGNVGASLCVAKNNLKKIKKKYKKIYVNIKKGDCIIHNPLVVHGSEKNTSLLDRAAFNFSIKSKRTKLQYKSYIEYKKNLSIFLKNSKKKN